MLHLANLMLLNSCSCLERTQSDSQLIRSRLAVARDIREAGTPDARRIWILPVLWVAIHSNGPNSLGGLLIPGVRNAEQCDVGTDH